MSLPIEIELKFQVPKDQAARVATEMARGSTSDAPARIRMVAAYMDSADRRLARAGIAWRLRREGRRWVQTLKKGSANPLERFEHEVRRPGPTPDASLHAGTEVGDELIAILEQARAEGVEVDVRFRTEVWRTLRRLRTRGATVEIAFDEGRVLGGERVARIRELEFELVSGRVVPMVELASRWCRRFGLVFDPRSKAERGDALADGSPLAPVRKARALDYPVDASAAQALGEVLDECLAQVGCNMIGLVEGDADKRVVHVHQTRVGIRRLRSALRCFADWTPAPPPDLVDDLRRLFTVLGESRDDDVLEAGVAVELQAAGAPRLTMPSAQDVPDPVAAVGATEAQQLLLAWIAWRAGLAAAPAAGDVPVELRDQAERRLRRWHRRIAADWKRFDTLDEEALHSLRKRIKRQRYAVEFFAPVLRRRAVGRYLERLEAIQERMGRLNDLFVARSRYQSLVEEEPGAWFAVGWLVAQINALLIVARPELGHLAKSEPLQARGGRSRSKPRPPAAPDGWTIQG
ncbi:MAG: CYTH and CHAD domain-containing protein [Burkholderiaceae bacterium]